MSDIITSDSDPILWAKLYEAYLYNKPGNVTLRRDLYRVVHLTDQQIGFIKVETLEYLDSRSLLGSKKASYKKLTNASDIDPNED